MNTLSIHGVQSITINKKENEIDSNNKHYQVLDIEIKDDKGQQFNLWLFADGIYRFLEVNKK